MRSFCRALIIATLAFGSATGHAQSHSHWVPSWTTANYQLEPDALLSKEQRANATIRQVVRLSIGGGRIRIILTNVEGDGPLAIDAVHVALAGSPGSSSIGTLSDHEVDFGGQRSITIPAGESVKSDAIKMRVPPLARVAVSVHVQTEPAQQTGHLRSLSSSWVASGNQVDAQTLSAATSIEHWYHLAAVEVEAPAAHVIVALGDSITDGSRSAPNENGRWPDRLAERIVAMPEKGLWAVVNKGLAGNRLLASGRGASALARFDDDVLALPHVRTVILLEGINDLGQFAESTQEPDAHRAMSVQIIKAYEELISRAHAHGLRIVGATILPDGGSDYHPTPLDEDDRRTINEWIRASGHFDAAVDWDAVMRDPGDPFRLNPAYDSGDHIHPSMLGYRAMAEAIPIAEVIK